MRKIFIVICTLLASLCIFIGCNEVTVNFEVEFKENAPVRVQIDTCIDVEDYIVKVENSSWSVSFTYLETRTGESVTEPIKGVTYYPTTAGEYTMTYTVQVGRKKKSADYVFEVYGLPPTAEKIDAPLVFRKDDTINLEALISNANLLVNPVNAKLKVEKVDYWFENVDLEQSRVEDKSFSRDLTEQDSFIFEENGTYVFTVSVTSDTGITNTQIRVEVLDNKQGNDDVLKENGEYVSYNAELNGNTIRMVQAQGASYIDASYVVMDGIYTENDVFRVEFKGKNCPQIALLTAPNREATRPYGAYSGTGYTLSFERGGLDRFDWRSGKLGGTFLHGGWPNDKEKGMFGLQDFNDDSYYGVEVKIMSGSVNGSRLYLYVYEIINYGAEDEYYSPVYVREAGVTSAQDSLELKEGQVIFYGSAKRNITFRYYKPVSEIDATSFAYDGETNVLSWDEISGAVYYVAKDGQPFEMQRQNYLSLGTGYSGVVSVKSSVGYSQPSASVSCTVLPTGGEGVTLEMNKSGARFDKMNYTVSADSYQSGSNFIRLDFTGKNFPGTLLFGVQKASATLGECYGVGIDFDRSANKFGAYLYAPDLKDSKQNARTTPINGTNDFGGVGSKLNYAYFASLKETVGEGNDKNFVLIAGTDLDAVGRHVIRYNLYEKISKTQLVLLEANEWRLGYYSSACESGKIMITSEGTRANNTVVTAYEVGTYKETLARLFSQYDTAPANAQAGYEFHGVGSIDYALDGTATTATLHASGARFDKMNYLLSNSEYETGNNYIRLDFTGKNFPGTVLFGVTKASTTLDECYGIGFDLDRAANCLGAYMFAEDLKDSKQAERTTPIHSTNNFSGEGCKLNYNYFASMGTAVAEGHDKNFVLLVGTKLDTLGRYILEFYLYEKTSDTQLQLLEHREWNLGHYSEACKKGKIMITSEGTRGQSTSFTTYQPSSLSSLVTALQASYSIKE